MKWFLPKRVLDIAGLSAQLTDSFFYRNTIIGYEMQLNRAGNNGANVIDKEYYPRLLPSKLKGLLDIRIDWQL